MDPVSYDICSHASCAPNARIKMCTCVCIYIPATLKVFKKQHLLTITNILGVKVPPNGHNNS